MVEIGDAEEDEDVDVEVVVVEGDEVVHAPRLHTICETRKWQEDVKEWHNQG